MSDWPYSPDELKRYFSNPRARKAPGGKSRPEPVAEPTPENGSSAGLPGGNGRRTKDEKIRQAIRAAGGLVIVGLLGILVVILYFLTFSRDLPETYELENP